MSQEDYNIANGSGAAVRAELNNQLLAAVTNNSGPTAPSTTYPYMWWADTTSGILKQRNAADSAWISILTLASGLPSGLIDEDDMASNSAVRFPTQQSVKEFTEHGFIDHKHWPTLSIATDADHDITFSSGKVASANGGEIISSSSPMTKQIDAAWTAGSASGGLFSGTVAASTSYHAFLIVKDSDGSVDAGFDTSPVAANIPAGYTSYRRVGSFYTDGSANIVPFKQYGRKYYLDTPVVDYQDTAEVTSSTSLSLSVPSGIVLEADCTAFISDNAATLCTWYIESKTIGGEFIFLQDGSASFTQRNNRSLFILTDNAGTILHRSVGNTATKNLTTLGWIDNLLE